jgi:hypothetical protein
VHWRSSCKVMRPLVLRSHMRKSSCVVGAGEECVSEGVRSRSRGSREECMMIE